MKMNARRWKASHSSSQEVDQLLGRVAVIDLPPHWFEDHQLVVPQAHHKATKESEAHLKEDLWLRRQC